MTGPLFTDQRGSQRHAVELLDVEEEEELQCVHRKLEKKKQGVQINA